MKLKTNAPMLLAAIALSGCVYADGSPNRPVNGALIGGASGAVIGNAIGHDGRSAILGGVLGAAIGGAIGQNMATQERELNQRLAESGAQIINSGSQLRVILPESVTFPTGSAMVNASFVPALRDVAHSLRTHSYSTVRVVGHTDNVGSAAYNQQLSEDRARSVARILVGYGVASSRLSYSGRGYDEPMSSNTSAAGRTQNRRVEIVITPPN